MTGNELPEDGHVVRYVRPSLVEDEAVDGSAFVLRKGEATLSVNWLEAFGGDDQHHQLRQVRRLFRLQLAAKQEFYSLFGASLTPHQRGKRLETVLNGLFSAFGIAVSESFHLVGEHGEGIVEQVDGVVELKNGLCFVEMKWYKDRVGKPQISEHLVRLMGRAEARGLIISASDFTETAVHTSREFLQHKVVVLCHLQEIVSVLEHHHDLSDFLNQKIEAAIIHKNPYFSPPLPDRG